VYIAHLQLPDLSLYFQSVSSAICTSNRSKNMGKVAYVSVGH
jgi:hypothetical protein